MSHPALTICSPAAPPVASCWQPLGALLRSGGFEGATPAAQHEAARRWWHGLAPSFQRKAAGKLLVHNDARLPNNLSVLACVRVPLNQEYDGHRLPETANTWGEADYQRFRDTHALLAAWDAFRAAQPLAREADLLAPFAAEQADFLAVTRLKVDARRLRDYRARVTPGSGRFDGNIDGRGRGAKLAAEISAEAWELFKSLFLQKNRLPLASCWAFVAGEAETQGWQWPNVGTIRKRVAREFTRDGLILARQGPRAYEAACVPKIRRDIESILARDWRCYDCRKLDFMVRVPDARREWRPARLVLSGAADLRSRDIVLDLRATENSDGIMACVKAGMLRWGAGTDALFDHGSGYDAALRVDHVADAAFEQRIGNVFQTFGVTVHRAIPYHPWAKPIESLWKRVKEMLDRWLWHFWGGSPGERPEDIHKEIKRRVDELPTVDQVRAQILPPLLEEWRATPISGVGTRGLSPNLILEQYAAPLRSVDPALLEVECRRKIGPVRRTRQGFRLDHVYYGQTDEAVWLLPDADYWLGVDPERFDRVVVLDANGKALCEATNRMLAGTTREQYREAMGVQRRHRQIVKAAVEARDYLRETPVQQVLAAKVRHAQAREAALRAQLPAAAAPEVALVRPDLVESARRVEQQSRRNDRRISAAAPDETPRARGFARLAQKAGAVDELDLPQRRWADVPLPPREETA